MSPFLQAMRFPRPAEAGLLNTLPPGYRHHENPRAALCLVGQIAAPLQALWIFGQIRRWAEQSLLGSSAVDSLELLESYKTYLLQQRDDLWLTPTLLKGGQLWLQVDEVVHPVTVTGPVKACQLLEAEQRVTPWEYCLLQGCRKVPDAAGLHCRLPAEPYVLKAGSQPSTGSVAQGVTPAAVAQISDVKADTANWCGLLCLTCDQAAVVLPPLALPAWLQLLDSPGFLSLAGQIRCPLGAKILVPFLHAEHWTLLALWVVGEGVVQPWILDGVPGRNTEGAMKLCRACVDLLRLQAREVCSHSAWLQADASSCGQLLLAHAAVFVQGEAKEGQLSWAGAFLQAMSDCSPCLPGRGGLSDDQAS